MKTHILLLLFTLSPSTVSANIYSFSSSAVTPNNAYATTVDLGRSLIQGADLLTIFPTYGTTEVGFVATGSYTGKPDFGIVTVEAAPGSQVQFDGTWLTQNLDPQGIQTFALPLGLLDSNHTYTFVVFSLSEQAAFSGQIVTPNDKTNAPEPNGVWAVLAGTVMFSVRKILLSRKAGAL